jgi:hypothetical protein
MRIWRDNPSGKFQSGHRLLARYGRELLEKDLEAVFCLEIVKQDLHRDSRSDEHRGAPQDLRVSMNDPLRFGHRDFLNGYGPSHGSHSRAALHGGIGYETCRLHPMIWRVAHGVG